MEARGEAHYWYRALIFVKPDLKSHTNDRNDAEAICEAVQPPGMRFVTPGTPEKQAILHWQTGGVDVRGLLLRLRKRILPLLKVSFSLVAAAYNHTLGRQKQKTDLSEFQIKQSHRIFPRNSDNFFSALYPQIHHCFQYVNQPRRFVAFSLMAINGLVGSVGFQ